MGNSQTYTQEDFDRYSYQVYQATLQRTCFLPDVGIDESLLKYSGINSNAVLQSYSNELVSMVPDYIEKFGSSLGAVTSFPNAVGLGALVISMIMELIMKSRTETTEDSYSMFRRVFGEEKASSVRDTMSEYVRRHRMFMINDQLLQEELMRLERQLSKDLTILRNSLLHDQQMSTRGFKIWVNGASFHVQMLIHRARLNTRTGRQISDNVHTIETAISLYLMDLDRLLEKYKTHMSNSITFKHTSGFCATGMGCSRDTCTVTYYEGNCRIEKLNENKPCREPEFKMAYMNQIVSNYEPISGLKSHFSNIKNNLNSLINQRGSFTLPSRG
ncbi:uncharacterized protein LOC125894812 isoform X3 [Epinephelus fuscoguttatus]|uniref:uncharacterized protein LOC125894812 isoform X3 n=1 Tax=Epinephelus fuscoguttatus TaxID=293821 RepID=UPI0020D08055|nr:uncharacterized protein LOC125894812 isoform X3 [Epinephelus fuscoguttatus]